MNIGFTRKYTETSLAGHHQLSQVKVDIMTTPSSRGDGGDPRRWAVSPGNTSGRTGSKPQPVDFGCLGTTSGLESDKSRKHRCSKLESKKSSSTLDYGNEGAFHVDARLLPEASARKLLLKQVSKPLGEQHEPICSRSYQYHRTARLQPAGWRYAKQFSTPVGKFTLLPYMAYLWREGHPPRRQKVHESFFDGHDLAPNILGWKGHLERRNSCQHAARRELHRGEGGGG